MKEKAELIGVGMIADAWEFTGAWAIHVFIIFCFKIFYDTVPGVSQETSWTLTNISYMAV